MSKRLIALTSQQPYAFIGYPPARRPCLFVTLSNGASDLLGLNLADLEQTTSFTAGGPTSIYRALVTMNCARASFLADVRFNPALSPAMAFVGRADIFEHFLIGFDQRNQTLLYAQYKPAPRALRL